MKVTKVLFLGSLCILGDVRYSDCKSSQEAELRSIISASVP